MADPGTDHGAVPVDDAADPRLADYLGLNDPAGRIRAEAAGGFFIVEGALAIERLLALGSWPIRSILVTPKMAARLPLDGVGAPVYVAAPRVLEQVVGFDLHRGAVASVDRPPPLDPATLLADARLVAVLEGVNDHENLGALFRNAAAFGVDAVLLDPTTADPLYRRSVRVSMGHVLAVPFARLAALPAGLDVLATAGLTTIALSPAPASVALKALDPSTLGPAAVLLGAEGSGLSPAVLAAADRRVHIPMAPGVDSLNVATAAAVAWHHLA
jgi:tRNA G18 (ribose-2'-O)-methylase SpoU